VHERTAENDIGSALVISSLSNPLVKEVRTLRQHKGRRDLGSFIVEGIHHVGEAVEAGWEIEHVFYDPTSLMSEFAGSLVARLGPKTREVSSQVLASLAGKDNPVGLVAVVHQREVSLDGMRGLHSSVALIAPQDPGNVGTILRTLDGVGAEALFVLDGGVDPYHPTCVRASMGALFWKPVVQARFVDFVDWARKSNYQIIGSSAHATMDYRKFAPGPAFVLLLGSEQKGLSDEQTGQCDVTVSIPMQGRASSLNLAVAASILLYQFMRG
jgi:TrmH family RNA methyltransferase